MNAAELFGHWRVVRRGLLEALDRLTDQQLGFMPHERLWSLGTVARHIANAEEGWFRHIATGELEAWPPFVIEGEATVESVKNLLAETHRRTEEYLTTLDATELDRTIEAPWGAGLSQRWIIWHVLEHEIHHRAEIYLMLGMMGMEAPEV
jgi:uncharacterized damage-inducible protein DinB